jgi:multidrug efflux pump subunit AcrA (membrane-fusion protein)
MPANLTFLSSIRRAACLLCVAAVLPMGCNKKEDTPTPIVSVEAAHPQQGTIAEQISADAILTPLAQAAISPRVSAPVKKFFVQRGAHVKAGQLLATLENSDLAAAALDNKGTYTAAQAAYQTATQATVPADYTRAQLDLEQAKATLQLNQSIVSSRSQLFTQGAIPGRDLDTAKAALIQAQAAYDIARQHLEALQKVSNQAALNSAEGQLNSAKGKYLGAEAQLSYTEIRSPISGVVTDRPLFAGETASAGTPLLTVMDTSALIAKLHLAQAQAQQLTLGAPATVTIAGLADPVPAKVSLISPALDPGSTTVEIWLRVENPKGLFKAGTPVRASITGRTASNAVIIPTEALQFAPDGSRYVMVIAADSTAHKRPVTTGIATSDSTQILTGVSPSDTVITTGAYALDDNTKVKIAAADAPGSSDAKPSAGKDADDK